MVLPSDLIYHTMQALTDSGALAVYDVVDTDNGKSSYTEIQLTKKAMILAKLTIADHTSVVMGGKLGQGVAGIVYNGTLVRQLRQDVVTILHVFLSPIYALYLVPMLAAC